jgi:hypothetical protein
MSGITSIAGELLGLAAPYIRELEKVAAVYDANEKYWVMWTV